MNRWSLMLCLHAVLLLCTACRAELTMAITTQDLDLPRCQAFDEGHALGSPSAETLEALLGLRAATSKLPVWSTGPVSGRDRHFRIVFTQPIALGAICTTCTGGQSADTLFQLGAGASVSYLKPDAAYPGDVTRDDQWISLPPGAVKTLPPGVTVRALRFTDRRVQLPWANLEGGPEASVMGPALLLRERCYSALNLGDAKTSATWLGYWLKPLPVAGIALLTPSAQALTVDALKPDAAMHPALAPAGQWSRVQSLAARIGPRIIAFPTPISTTALRLSAAGTAIVLPLVMLGTAAAVPSRQPLPPPFPITYTMPQDGFIAIDIIEKQAGRPVRRLLAESARLHGPVTEYRDLKDDQGRYVPPGEYAWRAITRPPLKLTYEGTVNNAGQPPWYAPVPGGGGWMSDHCTPVSVRAVGNLVFHGTYGAEYGQSLIATDVDGNKVWAAQVAADRLTTDGKVLYAVSPASITRIDPRQQFTVKRLLNLSYTRDVPSLGTYYNNFAPDTGAAAVHGSRMVISYRAPEAPWLRSAFQDADFDYAHCLPMPKARPRTWDERYYDDHQRMAAVFLTGSHPSSTVIHWGEAPANGTLAGTLTITFLHPVPVGSILLPGNVEHVYALKPGAKVPNGEPNAEGPDAGERDSEDPFDPLSWTPLSLTGHKAGMPGIAVTADHGLLTRAIRLKAQRINYCTVFNRRYRDVAPEAAWIFDEGARTPAGGWKVSRAPKTPITPSNAPALALLWKEPVLLRGATIIAPAAYSRVAVDYWTGAADGDPHASLGDDSQWQQAGIIEPHEFSLNNPQAPVLGTLDFGSVVSTLALRVRVLMPAGSLGFGHPTITTTHIGGVEAILAYTPLGADPPLPQALNERITEVRLPAITEVNPGENGQAQLLRHFALAKPGFLAFDQAGLLYAVSGQSIVTLNLDDAQPQPVVLIPAGMLEQPRGMTFDAAGLLYVVDAGPKVVKVFDVKTGTLLRTIGTPGGFILGPYDPTRFDNPVDCSIDANGKLWVTDEFNQPKRITRWSCDGKLEKTFFGPTYYGGGGVLDAGDRSVSYLGMKFAIDWQDPHHPWKLAARTNRPLDASFADRTIYFKGRRYLVADVRESLFADSGHIAVIYEEKNGVAVPLAAAGNLASWQAVSQVTALRDAYAKLDRTRYGFVWSDLNHDGMPQLAEVQLTEQHRLLNPTFIGEDLSFNFCATPGARIPLAELRDDGLPVYSIAKLALLPLMTNTAWTAADGRAFMIGDKMLSADGKQVLWEYPDHFTSVQSSAHAPGGFANRPPGVLVGEMRVMGHLTVGKEELFVTNGNHGDWYAFTGDGLLAGCIFGGPSGYGRRWWSMPAWTPGVTDLSDLRLTVEDFYGGITSTPDGAVYAVAGKNHNSLVRVQGLERLQRVNGAINVSAEDIRQAQAWAVQRATLEHALQEPKIASLPYIEHAPAIDGMLDDWPESVFMTIHETRDDAGHLREQFQAALAYDNAKLYLAGRATDASPLRNSAPDLTRVFQFGDGLDIQLGLDPTADPNRRQPAPGDLRLVLARVGEKPVVMLYRYVVPGTPAEKRTVFTSPVGKEEIDLVRELTDAEIAVKQDEHGWTLEAAIPWKSLGAAAPRIGDKLRGDAGILESDSDGTATVRRSYWANKSDVIIGDLPCESRITPALWGDLHVIDGANLHFGGPDAGGEVPQ